MIITATMNAALDLTVTSRTSSPASVTARAPD